MGEQRGDEGVVVVAGGSGGRSRERDRADQGRLLSHRCSSHPRDTPKKTLDWLVSVFQSSSAMSIVSADRFSCCRRWWYRQDKSLNGPPRCTDGFPGSKLRDPYELDEPDDEQARKMRVAKDKLDVSLQSHPL